MFAAAAFFFFCSSLSLSLTTFLSLLFLSVCAGYHYMGLAKKILITIVFLINGGGGWFDFNLIQQFYWSKCRDMFTFRSPAPSWRLQPSFSSHLSFPRTTLLLVTNMVLRKKRKINASATCSLIWGDF